MSHAIRVGVVGATGYAGAEACRLLSAHSGVSLTARCASGRGDAPEAAAGSGSPIAPFDLEALAAGRLDCVVLATPDATSAELAPRLLEAGIRVIDLSGAFRLKESAEYPRWYGFRHPAPELLGEAVYGLSEWCGPSAGELASCRLVANPGCYATAALLALLPLMPLVDPSQPIVCDAKSGVTGAGRRADAAYSFAEVSGNFRAYGAAGHRHEPEIRQAAGLPGDIPFCFVPHLLPVARGILATLYLPFRAPAAQSDVAALYQQAYRGSRIVHLLPAGSLPEMRSVVGTPRCAIGFVLRDEGRRAVVVSVIDNLLKGAASQAVQNLNRMFGFDDEEGLH